MDEAYARSMGATGERPEAAKDDIHGVVITSAKKTVFAGGDLNDLRRATKGDAPELAAGVREIKAPLRRLETLGKPVVAAINGAALGGGLEIALAAHHRVILNDPKAVVGFPEVQLGLLPGGGGVVRTVRMLGITDALLQLLLQGQRLRPEKAKEVGVVDEVVDSREELIPAAKAWIFANPEAQQPWDVKGYKIPGGTPSNPSFAANLPAFPANLRKQIKGANYPAPHHIMAAAVEGAQVDFDTASRIESRYLVELVVGQQFKNMTQAFFFDLSAINAGNSRPEGIERKKFQKVGVIGAGMMGAGIAYVSAKAGMEVVLKDVSLEAAEKGKAYSEKLLAKQLEKGRTTQEKVDEFLGRIKPTDDYADLEGCDLVGEAVFESVELTHQVFGELEPIVQSDALLGSNTSTLPITELAEGVKRPEDFIGIHFFSPVDKMPLAEIIAGEKTNDATIAGALDYVQAIKKTPIVVNDCRGFFTSRVIGQFVNEGLSMLTEGVAPTSIDRAATQAGFPTGVLQLSDELNLELMKKIRIASKTAVEAEGGTWVPVPAEDVIDAMIDEGRSGRLAGKGFFNYDENGKRAGLWEGLAEKFPVADEQPDFRDLKDRLIFSMSLDTVRCLEEGVLRTVPDANIGSIFGIGVPPMLGGAIQAINGWETPDGRIGVEAFTERAQELAQKYGERFEPPALLLEKAKNGEKFA
jgi:3-hydroxyacyl-CoA dehydrogenase/enoyl-CoA hydratase/3-hydroxybutyryl-CoA epimerase